MCKKLTQGVRNECTPKSQAIVTKDKHGSVLLYSRNGKGQEAWSWLEFLKDKSPISR